MKKTTLLLIFLLLIPPVLAVPEYKGYVTDNANILGEWGLQIEKLCKEIEKNTTAEIAVLTIDSLEGMPIEEYSLNTAREWGVGKKETNNGLLLLIAYKDRKYRFETGYGLEGVLPDAKTGRIGRNILTPYFKQNRYGQGVHEAIKEIQGIIKQDPSIIAKYEKSDNTASGLNGIIALAYAAILIAILVITEKKKKHKWKIRTGADAAIIIASIFLGVTFFVMAFAMSIMFWIIAAQIALIKKGGKGMHGGIWWGGFKGGTGGSSGGFGGFGGGSFGGGGSSGGW